MTQILLPMHLSIRARGCILSTEAISNNELFPHVQFRMSNRVIKTHQEIKSRIAHSMCDGSMLVEYGLVGAFDTVSMMWGEETAILDGTGDDFEIENEAKSIEGGSL